MANSNGNFIKSYQMEVGINHVPAYQVSGRPFVSSSVIYDNTARVVSLPYVSRWFQVYNKGVSDLRVGFSAHGIEGIAGPDGNESHYFIVPPSGSGGFGKSEQFEIKVSEIWLYGATAGTCDVVSGLTTIPSQRCNTTSGNSWSGSAGVG